METRNTDNYKSNNKMNSNPRKGNPSEGSDVGSLKQQNKQFSSDDTNKYSEFPAEEQQERDPRTVDPQMKNVEKPFQPIQ